MEFALATGYMRRCSNAYDIAKQSAGTYVERDKPHRIYRISKSAHTRWMQTWNDILSASRKYNGWPTPTPLSDMFEEVPTVRQGGLSVI
ncbi:hypothetical protein GOBAR_DD16693 [Gossypium barbadense]|nr:hypothetical protein GOBAR_DD16693 [Gossypium barbadense]